MAKTAKTRSAINPINVKLGKGNKHGFYHDDVSKTYTEINEGKMPHTVLDILKNGGQMGVHEIALNSNLTTVRPDLATDDYGYSKTLPILMRDFEKAGLIETSKTNYTTLTSLGQAFFAHNVRPLV